MQKLYISSDAHPALIAIVQDNARARLVAGTITNLTDNSAGDVEAAVHLNRLGTNIAASGSNLAGDTTSDAAAVTVANAVATLAAKANAMATRLGLPTVTNSSGGTSGGNTMAAVTQTVTGASTGVQKAGYDAFITSTNKAFSILTALVNSIARATGEKPLSVEVPTGHPQAPAAGTITAVTVDLGAAAATGIAKAEIDAALAVCANNAATLAAKLTACNTAAAPSVLAV